MKVLFVLADLGGDFRKKSPFIYSQGESLKKIGIKLDYFLLKGKGFFKYIIGIFQLKKYIKENQCDIIHAHYSYAGWVATFYKKIPLLVSFMGSDILEHPFYLKKIINKMINIRVIKKADFIICKSEEIKEKIFDYKGKNIVVIPNGVNFNIFFPIDKNIVRKKLGLEIKRKYILFVSNPNRKEKNYKFAKKIFDFIKNKNIELLVVFNKTQKELNFYYNACDVLLLTSQYEGSPNIIKEAMACNLPIVSTNVGDVKKIIGSTNNCYVTSFLTEDIVKKIKIVFSNNKRTNGRSKIHSLKDDIISKKIFNIYKRCILIFC